MTNFRVSVIVITYGQEKYILDAINSIYDQKTDFPVELIIANDKSPDMTDEIVQKIINNAPKNITVRYTIHDKNKGMMANFIWALENAQGKYIALCEGDDFWTDSLKLQKQVDFLELRTNCVFIFTGANITKEKEKGLYFKHKNFTTGIIPKKNFMEKGGGDFCTATVMFQKKIIMPIPNYLLSASVGDFPLGLLAISKGDIGYLEDITATYRQNTEGSWTSKQSHQTHKKQYYDDVKLISEFNKETNFEFDEITKHYLDEYRYNFIYREIIENYFLKSIIILLQNLSFINQKKNFQLFKTFLWKIKNNKNIF